MLVYDLHSRAERKMLWDDLRYLKVYPLLIIGEFNEVVSPEERKGGVVWLGMEDLGDWIQQMNVIYLPLIARKYTRVKSNSCSRLDRIIVDYEWTMRFPELKLWA